jgi:hypothetical protein
MYDRVVVRAWELILNSHIAECLYNNQDDFALLTELLSNGCVQLLTTRPTKYPGDLINDPYQHPISARVEDQSKHRRFGRERWAPKRWQRDLCQRLDEVVRRNKKCLIFAKDFPKQNLFAAKLANILENRNSYKLSSIREFSGVEPIADLFASFCREPEAYKRFLRSKHVRKFDRDEFFRIELYRCANPKYFPAEVCRAITNLGQSVYMALECDREGLVGRWGEALREPPSRFLSEESKNSARDFIVRLQPAPSPGKALAVPVGRGLGKALAETRRSKAFDNFQKVVATMGRKDGLVAERAFNRVRDDLADVFAEEAARRVMPRSRPEGWLLTLAGLACGGATLGWCIKQLPLPERYKEIVARAEVMLKGVGVASHGGFLLSRLVRSALFIPAARESVVRAIAVRRTTIDLDDDESQESR